MMDILIVLNIKRKINDIYIKTYFMNRIILEEINRISEIMGVSKKPLLVENRIFTKVLEMTGAKDIDAIMSKLEKKGVSQSERDLFSKILEKDAIDELTVIEQKLLSDVLRKIYAEEILKSIEKLEVDILRKALDRNGNPIGSQVLNDIHKLFRDTSFTNKEVTEYIDTELSSYVSGVNEINVKVWRDEFLKTPIELITPVGEIIVIDDISKEVSMMSKPQAVAKANEIYKLTVYKDPLTFSVEELSWLDALFNRGDAFTEQQFKDIYSRTPSVRQWVDLKSAYDLYKKQNKGRISFDTFDEWLRKKAYKKPSWFTNRKAGILNSFENLSKPYVTFSKFEYNKAWAISFLQILAQVGTIGTGLAGAAWYATKRFANKMTKYVNDLSPLSNEEIQKAVKQFFNYDDPKIDGTPIYGTVDASNNSGFRETAPVATILSAKEGTIKLNPPVSVNGVKYDTFKFEISEIPFAGSENFVPHKMSIIKSSVKPEPVKPEPVKPEPPTPEPVGVTFENNLEGFAKYLTSKKIPVDDDDKPYMKQDSQNKNLWTFEDADGAVFKYLHDGKTFNPAP